MQYVKIIWIQLSTDALYTVILNINFMILNLQNIVTNHQNLIVGAISFSKLINSKLSRRYSVVIDIKYIFNANNLNFLRTLQ